MKFRCWDKDYEKMWDGDELYIAYFKNEIYVSPWDLDRGFEDYVLMQYTGLKDKNGVEIYEGDIVTTHRASDILGEVVMYKGCWCIKNKYKSYLLVHNWDKIQNEVIGNIYENPEILEK